MLPGSSVVLPEATPPCELLIRQLPPLPYGYTGWPYLLRKDLGLAHRASNPEALASRAPEHEGEDSRAGVGCTSPRRVSLGHRRSECGH